MSRKFGVWFKIKGMDARWLPGSPVGRMARCDRINTHLVHPGEPRLQIDTDVGPVRKRGKGVAAEWLCVLCAINNYSETPPSQVYENQEQMDFD